MSYQPKTGEPCHCKRGAQRDNCPDCEGTGMRVDFRAIRAMPLANVNHCDFGHETCEEVRLLPTSGGEMHGNSIVCHHHFNAEIRARVYRKTEVTAEFNPYPTWESLKVYTES